MRSNLFLKFSLNSKALFPTRVLSEAKKCDKIAKILIEITFFGRFMGSRKEKQYQARNTLYLLNPPKKEKKGL